MGIVILFGVSIWVKLSVTQIGFVKEKAFRNLIKGLGVGCGVFILAYGIEIMIAITQGSFRFLQLYVSTYAVSQNIGWGGAAIEVTEVTDVGFAVRMAGNVFE
jgi:hypothetical protein